MSGDKKYREFLVTRTDDNKQLGLSLLIDSLNIGETATFVRKEALLIEQAAHKATQEKVKKLREALEFIIKMNLQTARDKYGDASKAEVWACVVTARQALAESE